MSSLPRPPVRGDSVREGDSLLAGGELRAGSALLVSLRGVSLRCDSTLAGALPRSELPPPVERVSLPRPLSVRPGSTLRAAPRSPPLSPPRVDQVPRPPLAAPSAERAGLPLREPSVASPVRTVDSLLEPRPGSPNPRHAPLESEFAASPPRAVSALRPVLAPEASPLVRVPAASPLVVRPPAGSPNDRHPLRVVAPPASPLLGAAVRPSPTLVSPPRVRVVAGSPAVRQPPRPSSAVRALRLPSVRPAPFSTPPRTLPPRLVSIASPPRRASVPVRRSAFCMASRCRSNVTRSTPRAWVLE